MKKIFLILYTACGCYDGYGQEIQKTEKQKLLAEISENACKCVDSINTSGKSKGQIVEDINACIGAQTGAYELGSKLINIDTLKKDAKEVNGKKHIDISLNINENSAEYKTYYYEIERYMMNNCKSLRSTIGSNDKPGEKSFTENKEAHDYYVKGLDEIKKEDYAKALVFFEKAVNVDSQFAFAWDNLGICYRKLNNYDKAIAAYERSLEIDPKGITPLQNIAVAYQFKKEYQKAIGAYEKLAEIDNNNPEVYYGLGMVYVRLQNNLEKGLDNFCNAFNLYTKQKSPYRTEAEKMIQATYTEMKKSGKENRFNEILKANNISPN